MKYYLVAGEASGDLHGANLMKAILAIDPQAEFRFWGGDLMQKVGGTLVSHYKERAFMGLIEVIKNLRTIRSFLKKAEQDILQFQPDALIFIDNPGFNLRLAPAAKKAGIPVHFYISPKVWAWNESRIKKIKKFIDHLYCILPFEKAFFEKHHYPVDYVGNPVVDAVSEFKDSFSAETIRFNKPVIALLAGSRKHEIQTMLPVMWNIRNNFPDYQFVVAAAPSADLQDYIQAMGPYAYPSNESTHIVFGKTYELLSVAHAALVTSGTATLETGLFKVPQVVCYKFSPISYQIGKWLIKIPYISLVNLIANQPVVKELIQYQFTAENATTELKKILHGPLRTKQIEGYEEMAKILGGPGASAKTAALIVNRTKRIS